MPDLAYVPADGYTCKGFMRAVPGLHPDVRFSYRPIAAVKVARLQNTIERKHDRELEYKTHADVLVNQRHLVEWNIADAKGRVLPITVENFLSLKDVVFVGMVAIMLGRAPSDVDEEIAGSPLDRDEMAYIAGEPDPTGADAKNSETG